MGAVPKQISLSAIGSGARTQIYMELVSKLPEKFQIIAAADPIHEKVQKIKNYSRNPNFLAFNSAEDLLKQPKLSDLLIIGTQDSYHYEPCKNALLKGYDVLLEKPISTKMSEIIELERLAKQLNRKVMICYVLRYTPFYRKIKSIIDSGIIGQIITINASEGVMPWHQAHSFIRGHWANTKTSSPMIVAKCCHDMDIIHWLIGKRCISVSSFGELTWFKDRNAPKGATKRCTDDCKVKSECIYNAELYLNKHRNIWLPLIFEITESTKDIDILNWLKISPWGRCVFYCDNDAVDHQVIILNFEESITCTFTMTAFEDGRHIEIFGTKGILKGGSFYKKSAGKDLILIKHGNDEPVYFELGKNIDECDAHGGGDKGLIDALYDEISKPTPEASLSVAVHSHTIAFAAEESRITGKVVNIEEFYKKF